MNPSLESVDYLKAFIAGIGMSLTPCVYPLIPIIIGHIGASSAGSRRKGFLLSLIYVTGIAVTYALLGLLASLTGTIFGRFSSSPLTHLCVGIFIVVLGFSMLDLFIISLPAIIKPLAVKNKGYFSTFLLGISSGLVASPCLTPVLGAILGVLVTKKDLFYGTAMLLIFAYGMGFILIILGTFSSLMASLPKAAKWSIYIKKIGAIILIGTGIYFIYSGIRRL